MADLLGYPGEIERGGEQGVDREFDKLFNPETVPLATSSANAELQRLFQQLDRPSTPKPDMSYGYSDTTFGPQDQIALTLLPDYASVFKSQPWCPYWLVEWTSANSTEAELTARTYRDGASAVNALYNMYKTLEQQTSSPADTVVFTSAVSNSTYFIRVHWMDCTNTGSVSFEAEKIGRYFLDDAALVFQLHSMLSTILAWARGDRLDRIRAALANGRHLLEPLVDGPSLLIDDSK